jgi:lysozyme
MSPEGLARIRGSEAFIPKVYDDGVGNATIGYGHMLRPGESFPRPITQAEALELEAKDVARIVDPALERIGVALTQNQIDALGSFIYNVGPGNFFRSILPNLNRGDHRGVTSHMFQYIKGRNQRTGERITLRGLLRRRREEIALYQARAGRVSLLFPSQEWSQAARRLLANGIQFLRSEPACLLHSCRRSRSPSPS